MASEASAQRTPRSIRRAGELWRVVEVAETKLRSASKGPQGSVRPVRVEPSPGKREIRFQGGFARDSSMGPRCTEGVHCHCAGIRLPRHVFWEEELGSVCKQTHVVWAPSCVDPVSKGRGADLPSVLGDVFCGSRSATELLSRRGVV